LAVVATWVFLGPLAAFQMQIWQACIAWACFFHGGGVSRRCLARADHMKREASSFMISLVPP
jgi:hypothetical protein